MLCNRIGKSSSCDLISEWIDRVPRPPIWLSYHMAHICLFMIIIKYFLYLLFFIFGGGCLSFCGRCYVHCICLSGLYPNACIRLSLLTSISWTCYYIVLRFLSSVLSTHWLFMGWIIAPPFLSTSTSRLQFCFWSRWVINWVDSGSDYSYFSTLS